MLASVAHASRYIFLLPLSRKHHIRYAVTNYIVSLYFHLVYMDISEIG